MDPFRLCLAFGPVAVYLLLLGAINLARRPFLVNGVRDAAALGLALAGMVIIGPIELFFPDAAAVRYFGPSVWAMLLVFYALCLALVLLTLRPRLVIYNISVDQLRPILADLVDHLDPAARWAGDSLVLPGLGVQLHVDTVLSMRNVALISTGPNQSHAGWRRLEMGLTVALAQVEVSRNPRAITLLTTALIIAGWLVAAIARDPQAVAQSLLEMLRLPL